MSSLRLAALALLLGVAGLGCFSRLESNEARHYSCKTNDDCRDGWKCGKAEFCFNPDAGEELTCDVDAQCPEGFACGVENRCFNRAVGKALRCESEADCGGGWRCGLDKICYDREAAGAIDCVYDGGTDKDATECAPTWRCGLEGYCHERDAGAPYSCVTDEQCEAQWRCGLESKCVDTVQSALRDLSPQSTPRRLAPEIDILDFSGDITGTSGAAYITADGLYLYAPETGNAGLTKATSVRPTSILHADYIGIFATYDGGVWRFDRNDPSAPPTLALDAGADLQLRQLFSSGNLQSVGAFDDSRAGDVVTGGFASVGGARVNDLVAVQNVLTGGSTGCPNPCLPSMLAATDQGLFWAPSGAGGRYYNASFGYSDGGITPEFRPVHLPGTTSACDGGATQGFSALRTGGQGTILAASLDGGQLWVWREGASGFHATCGELGFSAVANACTSCAAGERLVEFGLQFNGDRVTTLCERALADGGQELIGHMRIFTADAGCGTLDVTALRPELSAGYALARSSPDKSDGVSITGVPLQCPEAYCAAGFFTGAITRVTGDVDAGMNLYRTREGAQSPTSADYRLGFGFVTNFGGPRALLGTVRQFPNWTFTPIGSTTFTPGGIWLTENGEANKMFAYLDRSHDTPLFIPVGGGTPGDEPPTIFSDVAFTSDGGEWLVAAGDDRVWAADMAKSHPDGGSNFGGDFLRMPVKMVPLPLARMQSVAVAAPASGSPLLEGYLVAQQRLFLFQAFSPTLWLPTEIRLPLGAEPLDVWMDGERGRVGTGDGRVYSLPVPVLVAPPLPEIAPSVLDYAEVCGGALALSPDALYLLRADSGPIGRWQPVPLDSVVPGFKKLSSHFTGPLYVLESGATTRVYVFSKAGAAVELNFTCP